MLDYDRDTRPKDRLGRRTLGDTSGLESVKHPDPASSHTRDRVTARPITRVDSQVVERATWMMKALTVLDEPLDVITQPADERALVTGRDEKRGVTLVEGDATASLRALPATPPKRKRRHWLAGVTTLALVGLVIVAALDVVTPLARGQSEGLAVGHGGPLGLSLSVDTANNAPTGQWVTLIGDQPAGEDIGGGAGPGVNAPGSAGLPVSKHVTVQTGFAAAAASGISAPPFAVWPPSYQFVPVPGYTSYTIYGSGGYYWWAFGQCTWWAQASRRNENLMHMGNAQFWASGARARGYYVSSTPAAGATVVFQPGTQGAGGAGHVAHVVKVYPGGWFLISEMNFYWNGGGWGRVDYRLAHSGWGVQFIY